MSAAYKRGTAHLFWIHRCTCLLTFKIAENINKETKYKCCKNKSYENKCWSLILNSWFELLNGHANNYYTQCIAETQITSAIQRTNCNLNKIVVFNICLFELKHYKVRQKTLTQKKSLFKSIKELRTQKRCFAFCFQHLLIWIAFDYCKTYALSDWKWLFI